KQRIKPAFNPRAPTSLSPDRRVYIEAFAIYIAGIIGLGALNRFVLRFPIAFAISSLAIPFFGAAIWPRLRGQTWMQWRTAVGLHTGRGVFREIFSGIVGYITAVPIFLSGIILTAILTHISGSNASHPITREFGGDTRMIVILFFAATVWAPI